MGPPHMGHGHGMHHGHGRGGAGVVPFRAGDWRCGSEGCSYHNFAKNVNCLRCGAPRSGAAMSVMDPSGFQAPPMHHGPPSDYGMGPGSVASTPGPAPYGPGANNFASGAAFAQPPPQQYGGMFPPMGAMQPNYAPSSVSQQSFGNPAAQAAFAGAADTQLQGQGQNGFYGQEPGADPFAFLSGGLGGMSINDEPQGVPRGRSNGQTTKSPA